jgi:putative DNA primase/helicase
MSIEEIKRQMQQRGYTVDNIEIDGRYHRFSVNGSKGKPGYYKFINTPAGLLGIYGDFVSGRKYTYTDGDGNGQLSTEVRARQDRQLAESLVKLKREHDKGAMAADFFWDTGREAKSHHYLKTKGVENYGLKICNYGGYKNWLMVPGYNVDGGIRTIQYIRADGKKRFETGAEKKGAFFEIPGDDSPVILAEGYSTAASIHAATGQTVIVAFDAGNLIEVARVVKKRYPSSEIIIAADNDQWKPAIGNTGVEAATDAAIEFDAKIAIPQFRDTETKPTDFNDLFAIDGARTVRDQIAIATKVDRGQALKKEVLKLLGLDPLERELARDRLAKKYNIRKSAIDDYLSQHEKQAEDESIKSVVKDTEPADSPVDGEELLNRISSILKKSIVLPDGAGDAITLWIMLTYCYDAFNILPILGISSPTKQCGKTTLEENLQGLTNKGLCASNLTPAAVYRTIEKYGPTLLIDEADTFLKNNDELRGVLNSGHTKQSAYVIRVEGEANEPVQFSTWGPKAIAMIGALPETIADRSVIIQLRRKKQSEKTIKTGIDFVEKTTGIRAMCKRWGQDHFDEIRDVCVDVPPSGNDRKDDNWQPLFAIAEVVGGSWPAKVRNSMSKLVRIGDDEAIGIRLLVDIKEIFESKNIDRIFSKNLVDKLNDLTESPWADWNRGKGLTTNAMARHLKPFNIEPKTMRIDADRYKGYTLDSFQDAFNRYITPIPTVTPGQLNDFNNLDENPTVTQKINVTDEKQGNNLKLLGCHPVTDEIQDTGGCKVESPCFDCKARDKSTDLCYRSAVFEGKTGSGIPCKDAIKNCKFG